MPGEEERVAGHGVRVQACKAQAARPKLSMSQNHPKESRDSSHRIGLLSGRGEPRHRFIIEGQATLSQLPW